MPDLKTTYMGLKLKNPIIVASSPLTSTLDSLRKCEDAGAGAVVLKSIFEEQINYVAGKDSKVNSEFLQFSDFLDAFDNMSKDYYIDQYLKLLAEAKKSLDIPVIASINCTHIDTWSEYAKRFEIVGADALELNYYPIASNASVPGEKVDRDAIAFAKAARKMTKLPVSLKIGFEYSSLAAIMKAFEKEGINALVLFNHFFRPDIDINELKPCAGQTVSSDNEFYESLRWIALMAAELKKMDFAGNTGVHSADTVIKMLLAGAKAVELCSVLMKNGLGTIAGMLCKIEHWMDEKGFKSVSDFRGKLAQENMSADGAYWERTQYMRTLIAK
ncbi:MAG: dihydroorotate dehydrogenase-like protein [Spirochaetales bacterium]|nr:dihydroorotate dehydrogenase-like protein [Spirochaetales bacterium]